MYWLADGSWHWIAVVWITLALMFFLALLLHKLGSQSTTRTLLCNVFQDAIRYGKTKTGLQRPAWLHWLDVPKRWFYHFYIVSIFWNGVLLWLLVRTWLLGFETPEWIKSIHYLIREDSQQTSGEELSTMLALSLIWLHSVQRLVECLFVSVFSSGVIHLAQYCFGLIYYLLVGITILSYSRLDTKAFSVGDLLMQGHWGHAIGLMLYIWASIHQTRCHVILAKLRKNKSGKVINMNHVIPHGDWFENVSCPHYFAELLIYVSISIVFGLVNTTWWLVVLYVLCCQALTAALCHEFYHEKFKSYPAHRKAFIPFLF
ncbi:polyprenol reductase [Pelobates fuscus]|uniref:polyprenol reductase n=1 Tax=Pelobates fuscus TaxID=191477 RepID=UPI002FE4C127